MQCDHRGRKLSKKLVKSVYDIKNIAGKLFSTSANMKFPELSKH